MQLNKALREFTLSTLPKEVKEEFIALLEQNAACRNDIVRFAEEMLGMPLNDFQKKFLTRTTTARSQWMEKFGDAIEDIGGFLFGRNIAFPSNQVGKGLYKHERVLCHEGWREIKDLKVGDLVYSQDGTLTKVKGVFPQGKTQLYRFTFDDGATVVADGSHRWSVITPTNRFSKDFDDTKRYGKQYPNVNYGKYEVMDTTQLLTRFGSHPKAPQRVAIPVVDPIQFPQVNVPIDPYQLGLLLGDGALTKGNVTFCGIDPQLHEAFGELARPRKSEGRVPTSKIFLNAELKSLGLLGHRSWEKFIPKEYLWNSVEVRTALLQGLMDTDGTIDTKGCMEYCTTSPKLAQDVKFIVQSLGGKAEIKERITTYTHNGEKRKGRLSYRVIIKIQDVNPFRLRRKAERFYNVRYRKERILHSIEQIEDGESVCIAVEHPSHLFITEDFIVTHNTVMIAIKHIYFNYYKIGLDLDASMINKAYYSTLNISPHSRQVKQCFTYVKEILNEQFIINDPTGAKRLNKLNPLLKGFLIGDNANLGELRFVNRAIMYTVPVGQDQASSLAGAQFGYISYDECAQSLHLENELGAKIMSRLIRYGVCLDLISTPEVDSASHQYYFHIVQSGLKGENGWWACGATLDDNKFIPKAQRERAKADLLKTNPIKYLQVVKGEFVSSGKRFFDHAEIENLWRLPNKIACAPNRKYLIVSDWGMSDTGDPSVHFVFDYTDYLLGMGQRIKIVAHEEMQGGSPMMQFALLRTLYEAYTWYDEDGVTAHYPTFLMDAGALGGVVIKKMLMKLHPKGFAIDKDDALLLAKGAVSANRDYYHSEIDGALIENNPNFGVVESYYIQKLADQMGNYKIPDDKITQDYVMVLMMGLSYLLTKHPLRSPQRQVSIDPLASYNAGVRGSKPLRDNVVSRLW